ncbi:uncharacterized protein LOC141844433 [Curcuma longa]|uniref:uncharacterized protein LOC141844433 n=1 Tax=Curcuma longa TaxID=136217 RepID=UPI003D9F8D57
MGNIYRSGSMKKSNEGTKLTVTTILGVIFGFFVGLSFPNFSSIRLHVIPDLSSTIEMAFIEDRRSYGTNFPASSKPRVNGTRSHQSDDPFKIYVESNPYGAELLPPGIVVAETDLYLRRLWGDPKQLRPEPFAPFGLGNLLLDLTQDELFGFPHHFASPIQQKNKSQNHTHHLP